MKELLFNQVLTMIRKLDRSMLIYVKIPGKDDIVIANWDDIELVQYGYEPVQSFHIEYMKKNDAYQAYIVLREVK